MNMELAESSVVTTDSELDRKDATLRAWEHLTWVFIAVSLTLVMVIRIAMGWSRDWQTYPPFWYGLYLATGIMMLLGWVFLGASLVSVVRRSRYRRWLATVPSWDAMVKVAHGIPISEEQARILYGENGQRRPWGLLVGDECTGCQTGEDLGAGPEYAGIIAHRRDDCPVHHDQDDQPSRARVEDM